MLTNNQIDELIGCLKTIIESIPLKGMMVDRKSSFIKRKILKLQSIDKQYLFEVFIRQNTMLIEQFSIGLRFKTDDKQLGKLTLMRYNGEHGQSDWSKDNHYSAFHIHKITEELLEQGIYEPKHIELTEKFTTFDSAMNEFIKHINILNYTEYFPNSDRQQFLFKGES